MSDQKSNYHHGSLPEALLDAAEGILVTKGLDQLSLRAIAKLAGVSHAAPKNHFDNLTGLLSALAARGYSRFENEISNRIINTPDGENKFSQVGLAYVVFARDNPELFLLMFRSQSLDYERPELKAASDKTFAFLSQYSNDTTSVASSSVSKQSDIIRPWAKVHGFAMLMIDGQLEVILGDKHSSLSDEEIFELLFAS